MQKSLTKLFLTASVSLLALTGCTKEVVEFNHQPVVQISDLGPVGLDGAEAKFTPNQYAASFDYAIAISSESTVEDFLAGRLNSVQDMKGEQTILFGGIQANSQYTVYAVGYSADGTVGAVTTQEFSTSYGNPTITLEYVTHNSVAVNITSSIYASKLEYLIDVAGLENPFEGKEVTSVANPKRVYFENADLQENTEYTLYYRVTNRFNEVSEIYAKKFKTSTLAEAAIVDFEVSELNPFQHTINFTMNENTSKFIIFIEELNESGVGAHHESLYSSTSYNGNALQAILAWYSISEMSDFNPGVFMFTEQNATHTYRTTLLNAKQDMELFIVTFDQNGDVYGVVRNLYTNNSPTVATATPVATIADIDPNGFDIVGEYQATYNFEITPDANSLGVFYSVFTQDNFEYYQGEADGMEQLRNIMHNQMIGAYQGNTELPWTYTNGNTAPVTYTETALRPGRSYYVLALPMSLNGAPAYGEIAYKLLSVPAYQP